MSVKCALSAYFQGRVSETWSYFLSVCPLRPMSDGGRLEILCCTCTSRRSIHPLEVKVQGKWKYTISYGQSSAKLSAIMSSSHMVTGHLVIRSSSHLVIHSIGHHVIMSSGHPVIMSSCHLDVWSFGHPVIQSSGLVIRSSDHLVIKSTGHPVIPSFRHFQHYY